MSITAVDDVCTDQHLINQFQGEERFKGILPKGQVNAQAQRQIVLDRVLSRLKNRTPPIYEGELQDPTELRQTVIYGVLAELCMAAITEDGDRWDRLFKEYKRDYSSELASLRPTVSHGHTSGPKTLTIHRR